MEVPDWFMGTDPLETADRLEALADDLRKLARGTAPFAKTLAAAPMLHRWGFDRRPAVCLTGKVYGHPRIVDGSTATTTEIFAIDPGRKWVRTLSRFYELGPSGVFGVADGQG
jgi:hypothetical protein